MAIKTDKGLLKYTSNEADNIGMGQGGSVFLKGASFTPTNGVVVAITMLEETTFATLTPEFEDRYIKAGGTGYEGGGDTLATDQTDTFPQGMTIFGRWTTVDVDSTDSSKVICYIG